MSVHALANGVTCGGCSTCMGDWPAEGGALAFAGTDACFGPEAPPETIEGPGWQDGRIANLRGLNDAGRRLRKTLEAIREADDWAQEEMAPLLKEMEFIKNRLDETLRPLKERADRLEGHIRGFCAFEGNRAEILKGLPAKSKSKTLPSGLRLSWRHDPGGYRWDDSMKESERKAKLLEWALEEQPRATGTVELTYQPEPVVHLEAIKAYADKIRIGDIHTRFVPPGLKYVEPSDVLSITTDADGEKT